MTVRGAPRVSRNATVARRALATIRPVYAKDTHMSIRRAAIFSLVPLMVLAGCASDDSTEPATTRGRRRHGLDHRQHRSRCRRHHGGLARHDSAHVSPSKPGESFPADRCEANKAAGTITYLSSFDFSASASIVDVLVAKQKGYFDDLCLDVKV